ncbi:MAG TPA: hypothetical protein VMT99_04165 [Candidatus Paceibacterota bacterium]|nr:hypothetical protein [Candidatus Paceibacterota bacterium]
MKKSNRQAAEIGAGVVTAAALAAAAAYWVSQKTTKTQRAKAKAWLMKAKKEIAKNASSARSFGQGEYQRIVDRAIEKYGSLEDMSVRDMKNAARDLKAEWSRIKGHAEKAAKRSGMRKPARSKAASKKKTKRAPARRRRSR